MGGGLFLERYTVGLRKARFIVLIVWLILGGLGTAFTMKFIQNTTQSFKPPEGSAAAIAINEVSKVFPNFGSVARFSIFIQATDEGITSNKSVPIQDNKYVQFFMKNFTNSIELLKMNQYPKLQSIEGYYQLKELGLIILADSLLSPDQTAMTASTTLSELFFDLGARNFGTVFKSTVENEFLRQQVEAEGHGFGDIGFTVEVAGLSVFLTEMISSIEADMGMMDAIVMPIALIVMCYTVKSVRLIILPILSIGMTLTCSFGVMYIFTLFTEVNASTPSLMMSLAIAMSIDYNLFIGSRYVVELQSGLRGPEVVSIVLASSGRTILVSGTTLMLTFLGLILFPMDVVKNFGYGCGSAILISMLVSLTLTPALLLTFPNFFEKAAVPLKDQWLYKKTIGKCLDSGRRNGVSNNGGNSSRGTSKRRQGSASPPANSLAASRTSVPLTAEENCDGAANVVPYESTGLLDAPGVAKSSLALGGGQKKISGLTDTSMTSQHIRRGSAGSGGYESFGAGSTNPGLLKVPSGAYDWTSSVFFKVRHLLRFPINVIVFLLIVGLSLGVGSYTLDIKPIDSFYAYLPRGSDGFKVFHGYSETFGYGYMEPYNILFKGGTNQEGNSGANVTGKEFFDFAQGLLQALTVNGSSLPAYSNGGTVLSSPISLPPNNLTGAGEWPSWENYKCCLEYGPTFGEICSCDSSSWALQQQLLKPEENALLVIATTKMEPTGGEGWPQYQGMLNIISEYQAEHDPLGNWSVFVSGNGPASMETVHAMYKDFPIIIIVVSVVVLLVIGIAFRSVVVPLRALISVALTEVFVFGFLVLTYQYGIFDWLGWGSLTNRGGITFIDPIVSFTVIVGVALDYDIFLITRIYEVATEDGGQQTKEAVLEGICHTGGIITAAGVIMAIAFFGLVISSVGALNVLGWFLCVAVLFDTFIIRTLVVPTVMSFLGKWNWWPTKVKADTW